MAKEAFVSSDTTGHADVPELGWYRPTSAEAKRGVAIDPRLLQALGVKKGVKPK